jgi:nicotinate-nucleotide adenylyltransferase
MQYSPGNSSQTPALLELPLDVGVVMVVGGTFNPVHRAHIELPSFARTSLTQTLPGPVWLLFIPAGLSPFKVAQPPAPVNEPSPRERAALVRLAIRGVPHASVWEDEIDRFETALANHTPTPNYTIDTIRKLQSLRPSATLRLLLGTDQLVSFHRWKEARALLALAPPVTLLREPFTTPAAVAPELACAGFWSDEEVRQLEASCIPAPLMPFSATSIRQKIATGLPAAALPELAPAVAREIDSHAWYRPPDSSSRTLTP